ncbi:hypothetical protein A3C57_02925 [Candidatus Nomurabacteria bacterium RIFCSPHIGHO2_02_FULL_33_12]|uniref:Damage-inducible protein J n=1 Tax=Candidatus Nomurabacteria bacterium RIFCSPLOWO2_01_FULL_33_17 TaxID=1801764 RepID=A0A1F6WNY5_9BACT|nr:MAG: hypothetical protein A3C57_02925 [Candidatus Nomurabacteria bacterium RIFCSPHIGHO2_02_FULL_33_12]OGI83598.1 MAG: hypothetical protein A2903_01675 [Candidatus Nomurabacteria bacterium RIFCSPLOWO2_01_FULL_33_17]
MNDTTMLIKTKKDLKLKAQALASELGFSLTDIVNASLRQFVVNQGITMSKIPTISNVENKDIIKRYKKPDTQIARSIRVMI